MDPAVVVAKTLTSAWDAPEPGEPDCFPGTHMVAEMVLDALRSAGFCVVPVPENLGAVARRLESRNRGVPSYSDTYDSDARDASKFLRSASDF